MTDPDEQRFINLSVHTNPEDEAETDITIMENPIMPTTPWLIEAITSAVDSMAEEAMAATSDQRDSYHACLNSLNGLLGLALAQDDGLVFTMVDLGSQIQADLDTSSSATAARQPLEVLVRHLDTWAEKAILAEDLEQPR